MTHSFQIPNEFILTLRKDKKADNIKFSSEYKNDILTSILRFYKEFAEKPKNIQRFQAYKYHWSGISLPTVLEVTSCSINQLDPTSNQLLASYNFKDIEGLIGKFLLVWFDVAFVAIAIQSSCVIFMFVEIPFRLESVFALW